MSITCAHVCYKARSRMWQISAITNDVLDVDFVQNVMGLKFVYFNFETERCICTKLQP